MNSWYTIRARATGAEVLIYDEIGAYGVSAKGFLAELGALPEDAPLDLRLNSPGGSVFDAVAIYNALSAMRAQSPSGSTASPPRLPATSPWRATRSSCRKTPS